MLIENYLVMRLVYFNLKSHGVRVSVDHGCAKLGPVSGRKNQIFYISFASTVMSRLHNGPFPHALDKFLNEENSLEYSWKENHKFSKIVKFG